MAEYGPIEIDKDAVRERPLTLPEQFEWDIVDVMNDEQVCVLCVCVRACVRVCVCSLKQLLAVCVAAGALYPAEWELRGGR